MRKKTIIVSEHIHENGIKVLRGCDSAETIYHDDSASEAEYHRALQGASAVMVRIAKFSREMIAMAPALEIIAKHGVGVDNIDVAAATERKIPVTITPGANSDAVADHAMAMMLALARKLLTADADLRTGRFTRREHYSGIELMGKTLGIIGLGRIGSRLAKRASLGFDMRVMAIDPFIAADYASLLGVQLVDEMEDLLRASDFISVNCPLTTLTENLIGETELRMMKEQAFVINTARGGIIDEAALHRALSEKWIKGAGLDVFSREPPRPGENPLLDLKNVIVTPHIAGGAAASKIATMAAEEIVRVLSGRRPKYPINPEIYD